MAGSGKIIGWVLIGLGVLVFLCGGLFVIGQLNQAESRLQSGGATLTIGIALLVGGVIAGFGVWFLMQGRDESRQFADVEKEKRILNIVATQGTVQLPALALEVNMPMDQVKSAIYDLVGKQLFTGYVDWKAGKLVSSDAAVINQAVITGKCPNCGAPQVVGGKGVIRCEYCGAEFFIAPSALTKAAPQYDSAAVVPNVPGNAPSGAETGTNRPNPPNTSNTTPS